MVYVWVGIPALTRSKLGDCTLIKENIIKHYFNCNFLPYKARVK